MKVSNVEIIIITLIEEAEEIESRILGPMSIIGRADIPKRVRGRLEEPIKNMIHNHRGPIFQEMKGIYSFMLGFKKYKH